MIERPSRHNRRFKASPWPRLSGVEVGPTGLPVCYRGTDDTVAATCESFSRFVKTGFS
ncbi:MULTISPECIES: hypothetical protein [unclassified Mesorhizobium]|uniref:hypothetical protein n=1 Tax=unclassified Mesorhizobium TaxID=325217 RepID=UPI0015E34729|nr:MULTISPECIES: hypothetical protein [unclassified Mesorhizobium]MBZ9768151.1 hypothetical protein [Mesorhizobium sp. CA6]MBZ9862125.1 hypothetical protein [Mesorhizobium sp. CA12]